MDIMMWAMIIYFVVTFLNQVVRNHLQEKEKSNKNEYKILINRE